MRLYTKKRILELHKTVATTFSVLIKLFQQKRINEALQIAVDLQEALIEMGESIEKEEGTGTEAVAYLEEACELLYQSTQVKNVLVSIRYLREAQNACGKCIYSVKNEIKSDKW